MRKMAMALVAVLALGTFALGQQQAREEYLDVYMVKVKPEKRADFDNLARQMVDANRRNNGDMWLALETMYGDQNTFYFSSARNNYADIEKATAAFEGALAKAFGAPGAKRMEQEWNNCLVSGRAEVWKRRWDLSSAPSDPAALTRLIGESRWMRTTVIRLRPGKLSDFEQAVRMARDAVMKADPKYITLVSQAVAGNEGTVFYVTTPAGSFATFDAAAAMPPLKQLMGEQGYQKWSAMVADTVIETNTRITRIAPEYSNAPPEIMAAAPEFWRPQEGVEARR